MSPACAALIITKMWTVFKEQVMNAISQKFLLALTIYGYAIISNMPTCLKIIK